VLALFPWRKHARACFSRSLKLFIERKRLSVLAIAEKRHNGELEANSGVKWLVEVLALQRSVIFL